MKWVFQIPHLKSGIFLTLFCMLLTNLVRPFPAVMVNTSVVWSLKNNQCLMTTECIGRPWWCILYFIRFVFSSFCIVTSGAVWLKLPLFKVKSAFFVFVIWRAWRSERLDGVFLILLVITTTILLMHVGEFCFPFPRHQGWHFGVVWSMNPLHEIISPVYSHMVSSFGCA